MSTALRYVIKFVGNMDAAVQFDMDGAEFSVSGA